MFGGQLLDLRLHASNLLFSPEDHPEQTVLPLFQERWSQILNLPAGVREAAYASEELQPRVEAAFDAPHAGWSLARYNVRT